MRGQVKRRLCHSFARVTGEKGTEGETQPNPTPLFSPCMCELFSFAAEFLLQISS